MLHKLKDIIVLVINVGVEKYYLVIVNQNTLMTKTIISFNLCNINCILNMISNHKDLSYKFKKKKID
jgi:hypothetical protein